MNAMPSKLFLFFIGVILVMPFHYADAQASAHVQAAESGGSYLLNHLNSDGSFVYEYDPVSRKESSSYNILRHAGATYSLLELFKATNDNRYIDGAEKAIGYLTRQIKECPDAKDKNALCLTEGSEIKLGGNGLALLALAMYKEATGSEKYDRQADGLAAYIVSTQNIDGEFTAHKINARTGEPSTFVSGYYPGEALLGLSRWYEQDRDERWMRAAHTGARWLITVRDRDKTISDIEHDHWLLYALNELHKNIPDPIYLAHAKKLTDAIVLAQLENGGYDVPARSTPAATRSEGLAAAYEIFRRSGEPTYMTKAQNALSRGIAFQLSTQLTPMRATALDADSKSIGGFTESLENTSIRIDYVQHNISSLLGFKRVLGY